MSNIVWATLEQAERMGYDPQRLLNQIESGTLTPNFNVDGDYIVPVKARRSKEEIIQDEYAELSGVGITFSKASKKYSVPNTTTRDWVNVHGWIDVVDSGYPFKIDEAQTAYIANIYHDRKQAGTLGGAPLVDDNGLPYELLHPELSNKRKKEK